MSCTVMGDSVLLQVIGYLFLSLDIKSRSAAFVITYSRSLFARAKILILLYSLYPHLGSMNLFLFAVSYLTLFLFVLNGLKGCHILSNRCWVPLQEWIQLALSERIPIYRLYLGLLCCSYKIVWLFRMKIDR